MADAPAAADAGRRLRQNGVRLRHGENRVGVFQNRLLLELTDHVLKDQGFAVLKHQLVPPNDGGIALGQAVYAMEYLEKNKGRL